MSQPVPRKRRRRRRFSYALAAVQLRRWGLAGLIALTAVGAVIAALTAG